MANKNKTSSVTLKTVVRSVPCRLTDAELLARADELSGVVQDTTAEEGRQTDIKAQLKARLTELDARKTRLALTIGRKEEHRDVDVAHVADLQAGTVTVFRTDTGEAMDTRPMTDAERQDSLPLTDPAA